VTFSETAQFYKHKHPANVPRKTVAEVVKEFIADRKSAGCSAVHIHDLDIRLGQFSKAFLVPIMAVNAVDVQQWVYGLKNQKNQHDTSARTKENMLRQIASLFNFARRQKYVPTELALEISEILAPKKQHAPIGIYNPDQIVAILRAADAEIIPALIFQQFSMSWRARANLGGYSTTRLWFRL
jgi:site-specific recombinase XerD